MHFHGHAILCGKGSEWLMVQIVIENGGKFMSSHAAPVATPLPTLGILLMQVEGVALSVQSDSATCTAWLSGLTSSSKAP